MKIRNLNLNGETNLAQDHARKSKFLLELRQQVNIVGLISYR